MDFNAFKNMVIARAQELGIAEYELYYASSASTMVKVFQHQIEQFSASEEGGVCFRCIVNGKMGYASTEELSPQQAAGIVDRAADNATVLESEEQVFLGEGGQTYEQLEREIYDLPSTEALIKAALTTQEQLYAVDPGVVDGSETRAISEASRIAICNSKGLDLSYENNLAVVMTEAVVARDGEKANEYAFKLGKVDTVDTAALAKKAVQEALAKLGAEVAPTGNYPVVFSPEAMSSILNVFSSVFSSEAAQKGLSRLADKEGAFIAAGNVTLVDDPFHKDNPMPIHFDAEGSPTRRKNIIEKGQLKTLLYNLKTAAVVEKTTTGNASKAGYDAPIGLRPFTMYLAGGDLTEAELLKKAGKGVYISQLQGLHAGASPVTGDFSLQSSGFLIENGVKTTPVKGFTVAGNFYDLLKNITALADDVQLPKALGMTAFGAPTTMVEGLSVAGK